MTFEGTLARRYGSSYTYLVIHFSSKVGTTTKTPLSGGAFVD